MTSPGRQVATSARPEIALLSRLVDYAGLFPPAGLPMPEAVANFATYHRLPEAWMLGRFVVPAARLEEFAEVHAALPPALRAGRWELSTLLGKDAEADVAAVLAFNEARRAAGLVVVALETPADSPARVALLRSVVPTTFELYLELPLTSILPRLVEAVRAAGASAKLRAGGTRGEDFPAPDAVLAFLVTCADARISFKATAGLHHPVRGMAPLTYAPASDCAVMFGYLNLFLAAAVLWNGRPREEAARLLTDEDRTGLVLQDDGISWGGIRLTVAELERTRREFARSIGSCSFTEPVEEIRALGARLDLHSAGAGA